MPLQHDPLDSGTPERLLCRLFQRYPLASRAALQDAIAEALYRYCRHHASASSDPVDAPFAWLLSVADNALLNDMRRARRTILFPSEERAPDVPDEDAACQRGVEEASVARILWSSLAPRVATTLWLHDIEDWKPSEIAVTQQRTVNAVNLDIKRGHATLRRLLRKEAPPPRDLRKQRDFNGGENNLHDP